MGGDQHGGAVIVKIEKQFQDFERQIGVEIAGRLVGEQDGRPVDNGAGDADALLFAARQHDRAQPLLLQQTDLVERGAHPLRDLRRWGAGDEQGQGDIVVDRAVEQQAVVLKHHAQVASIAGMCRAGKRCRLRPATISCPRVGRSMRAINLSKVLLPAPEWPVRNTISPAASVKLTALSAS